MTQSRKQFPVELPVPPLVSVVVPVRNEENYMRQFSDSLKALNYPPDSMEVILADGRSSDRTVEIGRVAGFRIVDNPEMKVSSGRNAGFESARGQIIAFTDADCIFDHEWIANACKYLKNESVGGVGGPTKVPENQNMFGKGVGLFFDLAGFLGITVHRSFIPEPYEAMDLPGCNCFYRREALESVMPTDTLLGTNEDVEMNARIRKKGFKLLMTPDVCVEHYKRTTAKGLFFQMYRFALGRVKLGRRDPEFLSPLHRLFGFGLPFALIALMVSFAFLPVAIYVFAAIANVVIIGLLLVWSVKKSFFIAVAGLFALVAGSSGWLTGFLRETLFPTPERMPQSK